MLSEYDIIRKSKKKERCENCKHYVEGNSKEGYFKEWLTTKERIIVDGHEGGPGFRFQEGACTFMPKFIYKEKISFCGQFKEKQND